MSCHRGEGQYGLCRACPGLWGRGGMREGLLWTKIDRFPPSSSLLCLLFSFSSSFLSPSPITLQKERGPAWGGCVQ